MKLNHIHKITKKCLNNNNDNDKKVLILLNYIWSQI
jgi:hypothetical protein